MTLSILLCTVLHTSIAAIKTWVSQQTSGACNASQLPPDRLAQSIAIVLLQPQIVTIRQCNIVPSTPEGFPVPHAGEEEAAGQDAVHVADIEAYKVKDLWLELEVMSPVSNAGSYSVAVVLYDGGEPVQAAGSPAGIKAQSQFKVRNDYAFRRSFSEKPSVVPGCPGVPGVPMLQHDHHGLPGSWCARVVCLFVVC